MRRGGMAIVLGSALLAIVGYNLYAVRSGACPCQEFWTPTMLVAAAALLLLAGLGVWLLIRDEEDDARRCPRCARRCHSDWSHCPDCGVPVPSADKETSR